MASYDDNDRLGVWGEVGEKERDERPANVQELMQDEAFLEDVAVKVFKSMMPGCSMYRMQKMGKFCIKSLPYLISSGSLRERDIDKIADEEKFGDWNEVMSSDAWPSYVLAMAQISMCTCLIEENLSGDRISDWHGLLENSGHFQS